MGAQEEERTGCLFKLLKKKNLSSSPCSKARHRNATFVPTNSVCVCVSVCVCACVLKTQQALAG